MLQNMPYKKLAVIFILLGFIIGGPGVYLLIKGYKVIGGILVAIAALIALIYTKKTLGGLLSFMAGAAALIISFLILTAIFN